MTSTPALDTRTQILDTAERLFADQGIDAVSIRAVIEAAGVNLAAVHYHFGNRDELIREVLRRRVAPMNAQRLGLLDELETRAGTGPLPLSDVLRAFVGPVFRLVDEHPHLGWLLAHVDVTPDEKLRMYFYSLFMELVWRYGVALRRAVGDRLTERQAWTRLQFTWGAMVFTIAKRGDREVTAGGQIAPLPVDALIDEWVAFCTAGLCSPGSDAPKEPRPATSGKSTDKKNRAATRATQAPPRAQPKKPRRGS